MSYQVLARKWRPRNFSELVGQTSTVQTLSNALNSGRLHHAYLFTGTRGVGKTTIARILAKSFNCETGVTATPCGTCSNCQAIDMGNFIDLIEIDAASRTKVEDTRELLDNVQFLPTRGRFKIYLIDEVHMLSRHSFNALLKTLEEPPDHTKFFLATTDPQKLPPTILSRCLKFNLRKISAELINEHLNMLLEKEAVSGESQATQLLSHYAEGSLRDALSLLDQAIAHGDGKITETSVREMLGISAQGMLAGLIKHIAAKDSAKTLQYLQNFDETGGDFHSLIEELLSLLHCIAVVQCTPRTTKPAVSSEIDIDDLAQQFNPEDIQLYYQIMLKGRADIHYAPTPKAGMEMLILRMLLFSTDEKPMRATEKKTVESTGPLTHRKVVNPPPLSQPENAEVTTNTWPSIVKQLNLSGMTGQLANHCKIKAYKNQHLALELAKIHAPLLSEESKRKLLHALKKVIHTELTLSISAEKNVANTPAELYKNEQAKILEKTQQSFTNDPAVNELKSRFDAEIIRETIQPKS